MSLDGVHGMEGQYVTYFRDVQRFRGTSYLGSGRVGALPSSTRFTRRDRPVRGKGRSSHIGCFVLPFASPITQQRRSRKWQEKDAKKRLFHQLKLDTRQFPTLAPCAMSFFSINRHSQGSGALPQILPRILVDLVQGRRAKPNRVPQ